jgi:hypothetical protein
MPTILRVSIHFSLHFLFPGFLAKRFYPEKWKKIWLLFLSTMLVDLDHLLSTPIFDPDRLSLGFHLLHTYPAIAIYLGMMFLKPLRPIGIGLVFHMFTDLLDYMIR